MGPITEPPNLPQADVSSALTSRPTETLETAREAPLAPLEERGGGGAEEEGGREASVEASSEEENFYDADEGDVPTPREVPR